MTRRDPLLPNAGIVARREYRDRVRSPFFLISTILLMTLALGVAMAPVALRWIDRYSVTTVLVVADDASLAGRAVSVADSILNIPPSGVDPAAWEKNFIVAVAPDEASADASLASGDAAGVFLVRRGSSGGLDVVYRSEGLADQARSQRMGFAALAVSILDWTAALPEDTSFAGWHQPTFRMEQVDAPTDAGTAIDPQEVASRSFLGVVFVVLLFLSVIIYGMWVATGIASEKSSRVMELMISAASPRQLLTGKVVGIGGAGLTQYLAIAIPALVIVAFQDRIASAVMGPAGVGAAPIVGLTPGLLLGYGVFFLLGFTLFALIYAAMGSFVSRPDDLQTLSLPLSLVAMAGYLVAVLTLSGTAGPITTLASYLPPLSPFVMLARLMIEAVQPWEVALSIGLLLIAIVVVAVVAARMYEAGVLLYGQRPNLRTFVAAARRAG
jgi:ABC-2 type transport system permease protein